MKVIFLDVDGVLNHCKCFQEQGTRMAIDGSCIRCLKEIVDATGAKLVVSSTWRMYPNNLDLLKIRLREFNMEVADCTPLEWVGSSRSAEIEDWIDDNMVEGDTFLVFDDHPQAIVTDHAWSMIITSMQDGGLKDSHVVEAIKWFNG